MDNFCKTCEGLKEKENCNKCIHNIQFTDYYREKLKKCPFCGKEAQLITDEDDYRNLSYAVYCPSCDVETGWYTDKSKVYKMWNTRV